MRQAPTAFSRNYSSPVPVRSQKRLPAPFIVGMGRSGTTLLRLMLDAHSEVAIPPETHFVPAVIDACAKRGATAEEVASVMTSDSHWGDLGVDADALRSSLAQHKRLDAGTALRSFYELYSAREGKPRFGDKTPIYVVSMRSIEKALPEARFIHMIRDGRDVALSRWKRASEPAPAEKVARTWRRRIGKAREQAKKLGHYTELRYEDLVTDTEAQLRRIAEFLDLDFDPAMLSYHERAADRIAEMSRDLAQSDGSVRRSGEERANAHRLTSKPPSAGRIAAWREEMSAEDREEFEGVAGDLLAELGYEVPSAAGAK